jgi:type IV secretion system protein VirB3
MESRAVPLHQSLIRPTLLFGADRTAIVFLYMIVAILVLALPWTWISLSVSAAIVFLGHPALIALCAYDPDWRRIFLRHLKYQTFYPAAAHPLAPISHALPSVPTVRETR